MKLHFSGPALSPSAPTRPSVAASVAGRMGLQEMLVDSVLFATPLTMIDHLVHGFAALEEYHRGGPKASAHLEYARRRIHTAAELSHQPARSNVRQKRDWLRSALWDLLNVERVAARAAETMGLPANDNA